MVKLLKGLLGKTKKAVVVNGRLLSVDRKHVTAFMNNYRIEFEVMGTGQALNTDQGINLIVKELKEFNERYAGIVLDSQAQDYIEAFVDAYTGAVVIENTAYKMLYDRANHAVGVQCMAVHERYLRQFISEYTFNYMDSFVFLLNRRIAAQHMSMQVRGHFVAGFYQPLVVDTVGTASPFTFGEHAWFRQIFEPYEKHLEHTSDSNRKLELSCVASCDISAIFGCPVVPQLERDRWMFICLVVALSQLDKEQSLNLTRRYGRMFESIISDEGRKELMSRMMLYAEKARKAMRVI